MVSGSLEPGSVGSGAAKRPEVAFVDAVTAVFPGTVLVEPSPWRGAYWESRARQRVARERERAERRAAAEPRPAPARNLEQVTHDPHGPPDLPEVMEGGPTCLGQPGVKVTVYSDVVRVSLYRSGSGTAGVRAGGGSARDADASSGHSSEKPSDVPGGSRSGSSIARSRKLVVHRARCLQACAMWTFTKRGKFATVDELWAAWRAFSKSAVRRFGEKWRYVAVPELHADGETWHLHVLVDRFYMVETLRILWGRALGGTGRERGDQTKGNVHVKASRSRGATARRFASYVAKYVGKGFERGGSGRRLFSASAGLHPREVARGRSPVDVGLVEFADSVGRWLRERFGVERFFPRFLLRNSWECAIADCPLPRAA